MTSWPSAHLGVVRGPLEDVAFLEEESEHRKGCALPRSTRLRSTSSEALKLHEHIVRRDALFPKRLIPRSERLSDAVSPKPVALHAEVARDHIRARHPGLEQDPDVIRE